MEIAGKHIWELRKKEWGRDRGDEGSKKCGVTRLVEWFDTTL